MDNFFFKNNHKKHIFISEFYEDFGLFVKFYYEITGLIDNWIYLKIFFIICWKMFI